MINKRPFSEIQSTTRWFDGNLLDFVASIRHNVKKYLQVNKKVARLRKKKKATRVAKKTALHCMGKEITCFSPRSHIV